MAKQLKVSAYLIKLNLLITRLMLKVYYLQRHAMAEIKNIVPKTKKSAPSAQAVININEPLAKKTNKAEILAKLLELEEEIIAKAKALGVI
jgi:hypothetical protein